VSVIEVTDLGVDDFAVGDSFPLSRFRRQFKV
jgi:hypothetical protein